MAEQAAFGTAKYMYRQGILTKEENYLFHNLLWRQIVVVLQTADIAYGNFIEWVPIKTGISVSVRKDSTPQLTVGLLRGNISVGYDRFSNRPFGSSAFRLSTTTVSMSLCGLRASLSEVWSLKVGIAKSCQKRQSRPHHLA